MKKWQKGSIQHIKNVERGQSLMELAVSLVLLLIVLAGIVDLGRAIVSYFILQDAAEEGIVYGTSFPTDCNQITLRIRGNIDQNLIKAPVNVSITIQNDSLNDISCYSIPYAQVYAGKIMRITVTMEFVITMPFLGTFLGQPCTNMLSVGKQCIPMTITTNGVILRPPPPT
jgi:hypothetical protein